MVVINYFKMSLQCRIVEHSFFLGLFGSNFQTNLLDCYRGRYRSMPLLGILLEQRMGPRV
jgi:hypothetical protein